MKLCIPGAIRSMTPFLTLRHPCRESFRGSGSRPNSLSSILAADGDSGAAGAVDGGSVVGPAANVIKELLYARVGVAGIVRREAAPLASFGSRSLKFCRAFWYRFSSISTVISFPPVLLSAHAIQIAECPEEVPISSARVYRIRSRSHNKLQECDFIRITERSIL